MASIDFPTFGAIVVPPGENRRIEIVGATVGTLDGIRDGASVGLELGLIEFLLYILLVLEPLDLLGPHPFPLCLTLLLFFLPFPLLLLDGQQLKTVEDGDGGDTPEVLSTMLLELFALAVEDSTTATL